MDDTGELENKSKTSEPRRETPFALREYGEIPKGYIPLYIAVSKESLDYVAENGFRVIDNQSIKRHGEDIEGIFIAAGKRNGVKVSRTNCVYASPRPPHLIRNGLSFKEDKQVLLEIMVDPTDCIVVDGEKFTEASVRLHDRDDKEWAKDWADSYWEEQKTLKDYIAEGHDGGDDDWEDFQFPEVLIPFDIPTSRIKLVESYRNTKYD